MEMIIISNTLIFILIIICLVVYITYRQRQQTLLGKSIQSKIIKDQIGFTENHSLINDGLVDIPNIKLNATTNSDTNSTYNDSCYGSSEMDVHHQLGNKLTGKILLSSDDKYIILCKDQHNTNSDETHSSSTSSSSPTGNSTDLITKYQLNKRGETTTQQYFTQLKSSDPNFEFFPNKNELKKMLDSTRTFNYRNMTPFNEYYL